MIAPKHRIEQWLDHAENLGREQASQHKGIVPALILGLVVGLFFGFMAGINQ